jgi:hypothetical protein
MNERQMDERIMELQFLLRNGWEPRTLARLTKSLVYTRNPSVPGDKYHAALDALRDHLEACSKHLVKRLDAFVQEVPCTRYSRIRYMELLTGEPLAWGTPFDLNRRAKGLCKLISPDAGYSHEKYGANVQQQEKAAAAGDKEALDKARKVRQAMEDLDRERIEVLSRPLVTELLRVLQHMDDVRAQWEKAPMRALNFQDYFGHEHFSKVEAAMRELGIVPKPWKGKNEVVAALHAACERFNMQPPSSKQWPVMLSATFPGTSWGTRCFPVYKAQPPGYRQAYTDMKRLLR